MIDINDYAEQKDCEYKEEHYSVRDNGAIMRHPQEGKKPRKKDDVWTFGDTPHNGYIYYCGVPVHRVVATAFHGAAPTPQHIVDHIDTNRQNNRPENLRWLTKLENILLNEFTRKKIEYLCGSVENFLQDPSQLNAFCDMDRNFSWMRAVTKEEAAATLMHWEELMRRPKVEGSRTNPIDEWIFQGKRQESTSPISPTLVPRPLTKEEIKAQKAEERKRHAEEKRAAAKAKAQELANRRKDVIQQIEDIATSLGWSKTKKSDAEWKADVIIEKDNRLIGFNIYRKSSYFNGESYQIFSLEEEKYASQLSIGLTPSGDGSYTTTLCGKDLGLNELIEIILADNIYTEDTATLDTLKVRFIGRTCYACQRNHFIYIVTGVKCSSKPYMQLTMKENGPNYIQEIADELSPEVVRSVQQYLSEHKELNIPMGNIKERYSRTMNETYLSFGCPHCDAIVGDHYLFDSKIDYAYEEDDESVLDIPLLGSGVNLEKKHFVIKCP